MRPRLVLFGDSITEQSFAPGGWGAALAAHFARQVRTSAPLPVPGCAAAGCRLYIGFSPIRRTWCCAASTGTTRGGR
jgi:hypothetical protein